MTVSGGLAALLEQAAPGPWRECGADRGGCQCGNVWSIPADAPVGRVISDDELETGGWMRKNPASRLADGRLIALAPDMASLLIDAVERHPEDTWLLARFAALGQKAEATP